MRRELTLDRLQAFQKRLPFTLELSPTYRCQARCVYCYVHDSVSQEIRSETPLSVITTIIEEAAELGVREIGWLGGEPLTYSHFWPAAERVVDLGMVNNVRTNGLILPSLSSQKLDLLNLIRVHVDTLSPETYNEITGVAASRHKRLIDFAPDLAAQKSEQVQWVSVASTLSIDTLDELLDFTIGKLQIPTMLLRFRAARDARGKKYELSDPQLVQILENYYKRIGLSLSDDKPPALCGRSSLYCRTEFFIDSDATVHPCDMVYQPTWQYKAGNLARIWHENSKYFRYEPWSPNAIMGCDTCTFNPICFGCRSIAEIEGGDLHGPDPTCPRTDFSLQTTSETRSAIGNRIHPPPKRA